MSPYFPDFLFILVIQFLKPICTGQQSCFVFGQVQIAAWRLALLTEFYGGFLSP
jgi:hypothetical protein